MQFLVIFHFCCKNAFFSQKKYKIDTMLKINRKLQHFRYIFRENYIVNDSDQDIKNIQFFINFLVLMLLHDLHTSDTLQNHLKLPPEFSSIFFENVKYCGNDKTLDAVLCLLRANTVKTMTGNEKFRHFRTFLYVFLFFQKFRQKLP